MMQKKTCNITCGPVIVNDVEVPQITGVQKDVKIGRYYFDLLFTNMGVTLTIKSLADVFGITALTLNSRGKAYGYYHPYVLYKGHINNKKTKEARENPVGPQRIAGYRSNPSSKNLERYIEAIPKHPSCNGIDFRKYCVRDKTECIHYCKCLDGRVMNQMGTVTTPWQKPAGDCFVPSDPVFVKGLYSQGMCSVTSRR